VVKRERGFSMMEIVVVLAIFGIFIWIIVVLTADMRTWEKKMPVNFMTHPEVSAVVSRLRRDVQDACCGYYPASENEWVQGPSTLIVETLLENNTLEYAVWDFSKAGEVTRIAFVGNPGKERSRWTAHGTPTFKILSFDVEKGPVAVRVQAIDQKGKLAIDQIFQPRPH